MNFSVSPTIILFCIAAVAFFLSALFVRQIKRLRLKFLNSNYPFDFSRTFILFDPYEKKRTIIQNQLAIILLTILANLAYLVLATWFFYILPTIGFLGVVIIIVGLNLLLVREGLEAYGYSLDVLKMNVTKMGVGDPRFIQQMIVSLRKASRYYALLGIVCSLIAFTVFLL